MQQEEKKEIYYCNNRKEVIPFVPQGLERTLEFGCGQGLFSELLKTETNVKETWAVEIDEKSEFIAENKIDKVICADALDALPVIPDHYFDCVFFLDVLEHLVLPWKLLNEIKKS